MYEQIAQKDSGLFNSFSVTLNNFLAKFFLFVSILLLVPLVHIGTHTIGTHKTKLNFCSMLFLERKIYPRG